MGNKYGESIGIWNLKVAGADLNIRPRKGDNYELMKIINAGKDKQDEFFGKVGDFLKKLIERDYPAEDPGEKEELESYVEFNISELIKELMIAFRWSTRTKLESIEQEQSKKLLDGN